MSEQYQSGLSAPLFELATRELDEERRIVVLELGAARSGTIELFTHYRCRLDVADLPACLPTLAEMTEPEDRRTLLAERLTWPHPEPLDLILCWNILNYLTRSDISTLAELLAPRMTSRTRLHALMEYASPLMPATPGFWIPDVHGRLHASQVDEHQIDAPRYKPKELERLMPQLAPERTVLLANGFQEYLFRPALQRRQA